MGFSGDMLQSVVESATSTNDTCASVPRLRSSKRKPTVIPTVLCVFGTRPEIIKLAPVIHALHERGGSLRPLSVSSGQHKHLLAPFLELFQIRPDFDLRVMRKGQTPNQVCSRILAKLADAVEATAPDLIVVQGDTTTALAAALTGFHHRVPVAHVEAGLRSGDRAAPFPEEMNRQLISRLATYHFAATQHNQRTLLSEGVPPEKIFITGNPVVDSLHHVLNNSQPSAKLKRLLDRMRGKKVAVLTTHRRESFGPKMRSNLRQIRMFVAAHPDVELIFAMHPNPSVVDATRAELAGHPRVNITRPLDYSDFVHLLRQSWLVLSDSGGIQEEAPSLGKPVLVLRDNTERPEALQAGTAFLVGSRNGALSEMLQRAYESPEWLRSVKRTPNPFGDGLAGKRIASLIQRELSARRGQRDSVGL